MLVIQFASRQVQKAEMILQRYKSVGLQMQIQR